MYDEYYGSAAQEMWEGRPDGKYDWFLEGIDSHTNHRTEIPGSGCMSKEGAGLLRVQLEDAKPRRWVAIIIRCR